jgi:hypothetical protein
MSPASTLSAIAASRSHGRDPPKSAIPKLFLEPAPDDERPGRAGGRVAIPLISVYATGAEVRLDREEAGGYFHFLRILN